MTRHFPLPLHEKVAFIGILRFSIDWSGFSRLEVFQCLSMREEVRSNIKSDLGEQAEFVRQILKASLHSESPARIVGSKIQKTTYFVNT